jgi:KDO2-lipid IV(A) lauroyltransferase
MVNPTVVVDQPLPAEPSHSLSLGGRIVIGALAVFGALPLPIRSRVGFFLGFLVGFVPFREQKIVRHQLALFFPERFHSAASQILGACSVFGNVGRVTLESLNLQEIRRNPDLRIKCDYWPDIDRWLRDPRPLVVLTAHFGNWDLLAAYAIAKGVPITTIGREARSPVAQEALRWLRERYGVETIWRSNKSGLKRLLSCLREKRVIAALIDQDTRVESIFVPFFSRPTRTPSSLIELGKKFNARFVTAFLVRQPNGTYAMVSQELPSEKDTTEILTAYNENLERVIRIDPFQWVWFHKRWRSTPDGITRSSREYLEWLLRARDSGPIDTLP